MKKTLALLALLAAAMPAPAAVPTDQEVDAIIRKLEDSGKLDSAFDRAVERFGLRQQQAQRRQQEEQAARQKELNKNVRKPDPGRDHILGDKGAEVTLIEFSDYECPYCKQFNGVPQEVVKRLGSRVNFVWRHFPLDFHNPMAHREADAAECVAKQGGNDAFWKFTDAVMARTGSNGKGLPADRGDPLLALAVELKLDATAFKKCLDSGEMSLRVDDDRNDGMRSGVSGTPGLIIYNNKTGKTDFVNGAMPIDALEAATRSVLSQQ